MSYPHEIAANMILSNLHLAEAELEGREIVTVTGLRGVVTRVKLDDHHGLVFTTEKHKGRTVRKWFPVAFIREIVGYAKAA